jgi:hypothetical protein
VAAHGFTGDVPWFSSEVRKYVVGECGEEGVYVFCALFETDGDFVSVCDFGEADADGLTIKCQSER